MAGAGRVGKGKCTDMEFLRTIHEALVSTYRDVLREPLPPGIKDVLARLSFGDTYLIAKQPSVALRHRGS